MNTTTSPAPLAVANALSSLQRLELSEANEQHTLSPLQWLALSETNQQRALSCLSPVLSVQGFKPEDADEDFMVHAGVQQRAVSYREFSFAVEADMGWTDFSCKKVRLRPRTLYTTGTYVNVKSGEACLTVPIGALCGREISPLAPV